MTDTTDKRAGVQTAARISAALDWCLDRVTRRSVRRAGPRTYSCGTLAYTTFGLFMVFFWLLWGDFTMTIMEQVMGVLSIKFKELGTPNKVMAVLLSTVPNAMNFLVNPVVSFRSDRFRSRWGRRIPFLLFATPFITAALVGIAYAPEIGAWAHGIIAKHGAVALNTVIIAALGVMIVAFQFFNMIISSVYFYVFNDVVPSGYLARFIACFRLVSTLGGMTYNLFLFPHAQTHMRMIFLIAAAVYFLGFMSMCFGLKEGEYPPPPPLAGNRKGLWASIKTYASECFTHPYYLTIFAYSASTQVAGACSFVALLFYLHLGITLDKLGPFNAMMAIPGLILMVPFGIVCDRLHPLRVLIWVTLLVPVLSLANFLFLHDFRSMVAIALIAFPIDQMLGASRGPLAWLLFPKERFGQFGSADAMARSIVCIVGSVAAGFFLDAMHAVYNAGNAKMLNTSTNAVVTVVMGDPAASRMAARKDALATPAGVGFSQTNVVAALPARGMTNWVTLQLTRIGHTNKTSQVNFTTVDGSASSNLEGLVTSVTTEVKANDTTTATTHFHSLANWFRHGNPTGATHTTTVSTTNVVPVVTTTNSYVGTNGVVTFLPGQTCAEVRVALVGNGQPRDSLQFRLQLRPFDDEEYYRVMYLWAMFFQILAAFFIRRVHAGWKAHGGLRDYRAPSGSFVEHAPVSAVAVGTAGHPSEQS